MTTRDRLRRDQNMMDARRHSQTMEMAAEEIQTLRSQVAQLSDYRRHTERMLALFEGGPERSNGMMSGGEDIAYRLRESSDAIIASLDVETEKGGGDGRQ